MNIHAHGTGVTVLELMVTLAVAAILLALATPSWEAFSNRQRMRAAVGALQHDLLAARSQAVFRNAVITACPGQPAAGCSGGNNWSGGWIVFEDVNGDHGVDVGEPLLRHGHGVPQVSIHSPASRTVIRFFPDGSTPGSNGSIGLCGRDGPPGARRLVVSNVGRVRRDAHPGIDPTLCPA